LYTVYCLQFTVHCFQVQVEVRGLKFEVEVQKVVLSAIGLFCVRCLRLFSSRPLNLRWKSIAGRLLPFAHCLLDLLSTSLLRRTLLLRLFFLQIFIGGLLEFFLINISSVVEDFFVNGELPIL